MRANPVSIRIFDDCLWCGVGFTGDTGLASDWDGLAQDRQDWIDVRLTLYWRIKDDAWEGWNLFPFLLRSCLPLTLFGMANANRCQSSYEGHWNRPLLRLVACPYSTLVPWLLAQTSSDWPLIGATYVNACQSMSIHFWVLEQIYVWCGKGLAYGRHWIVFGLTNSTIVNAEMCERVG